MTLFTETYSQNFAVRLFFLPGVAFCDDLGWLPAPVKKNDGRIF